MLDRSRDSQHSPPRPFGAPRPRWPAMLGSLIAHATVLLGLGWLFTAGPSSGTMASPKERRVGMAIVHRMPDRTRYITEPDALPQREAALTSTDVVRPAAALTDRAAERSTEIAETAAATPPVGVTSPIDLAAVLSEMTGAANSSTLTDGTGPGASPATSESLVQGSVRLSGGRSPRELGDRELVPGVARAGQGAGQTTTKLFGIAGSGSTFVYVFDRSESMSDAGSAPLRAAKSELIRSLETLTERQQFQVIFYNDTPHMFRSDGDASGLVLGAPATIERARDFVRRTVAIGGTEHEMALRMALRLAPDVIFFLTDAKIQTMSPAQLDDITRRAADAGTTIHAIQFGTGPPPTQTFLEQLARRAGGDYRYVDVTDLK